MTAVSAPSNLPGLPDLDRHGNVRTVALLLGVVFIVAGIKDGFSCANRILSVGALLIFFGFAWHYATKAMFNPVTYIDDHDGVGDTEGNGFRLEWGPAVLAIVFAAADVLLLWWCLLGHPTI
jgi:hypothetical protein